MLPHLPEHALVTLLRRCYAKPRCRLRPRLQPRRLHTSRPSHRLIRSSSVLQRSDCDPYFRGNREGELRKAKFATSKVQGSVSSSERKHIAILGGGITGLSAAYYITRELPRAKVTIYEAADRLGGWLQSRSVNIGNGNIVLESGPRTLRPHTPSGLTTVEMIDNLKLKDELLITSRDSVAAQNRFVYYPDRLVKMPGPGQDFFAVLWSLITEPVFQGWAPALLEMGRPQRATWAQYNDPNIDDESVGSFLERRTGGSSIGNNLVSAVLHGIYAGDIYQLSARSLMPGLWYDEALQGSLMRAVYKRMTNKTITATYNDIMLQQELHQKISGPLRMTLQDASVYTFKHGIGTLSNALEKSLRANPNVAIKTGYAADSVENGAKSNTISIKTTRNVPAQEYTHVISTLYGKNLCQIANVPSLRSMHAVTVQVVNLFYTDPDILPERGFGYLLPRSIPFDQNPECALGVVFDSDATVGQDSAKGTKVTVMLGGHWWDGRDSYPDEEEAAAMAQSILLRHLRISEQPAQVNVSLQRNCIPQYTVGHESRMKKAHTELKDGYNGRLTVAGNSYTGVGLNDCVRAARDVVMSVKKGEEITGLEGFGVPKAWAHMKVKKAAGVSLENAQKPN